MSKKTRHKNFRPSSPKNRRVIIRQGEKDLDVKVGRWSQAPWDMIHKSRRSYPIIISQQDYDDILHWCDKTEDPGRRAT